MGDIDPDVLDGRDPAWRAGWERLTADDRARVSACVGEGVRMTDPTLVPYVTGFIAREGRKLRRRAIAMLVLIGLTFAWIVATAIVRPGMWRVVYLPVFVAELALTPLTVTRPSRRLHAAARAQGINSTR